MIFIKKAIPRKDQSPQTSIRKIREKWRERLYQP